MAASEVTSDGSVIAPLNITVPAPILNLKGFHWDTVDQKIEGTPVGEEAVHPSLTTRAAPALQEQPAALSPQFVQQLEKPKEPFSPTFPLEQFKGTYAGNGFNLIWRPRPNDDKTHFAQKPEGPDDNILELNLTTEQLTFGDGLGKIPNRGLGDQSDINLAGVPYLQTVQDVTDPATGRGDNPIPTSIHFEPGVWLHVPKAKFHPKDTPSVVRMASIPHGTTINAQGLVPTRDQVTKTPIIKPINTTPFFFGKPDKPVPFFNNSMDATFQKAFRIPQNLEIFNKTGTITSAIIKDPHTVLRNAIQGQEITETVTFEVSTGPPEAQINGGGTANISFLDGDEPIGTKSIPPPNPNANVDFMKSIFWIEKVNYKVHVKASHLQSTLKLNPDMSDSPTAPTPVFYVTTPRGGVPKDTTITVPGIQIQYSQTVNLNFGPGGGRNILTWPHVSVATLVPTAPQMFQMT